VMFTMKFYCCTLYLLISCRVVMCGVSVLSSTSCSVVIHHFIRRIPVNNFHKDEYDFPAPEWSKVSDLAKDVVKR